jgi:hypothetical protein
VCAQEHAVWDLRVSLCEVSLSLSPFNPLSLSRSLPPSQCVCVFGHLGHFLEKLKDVLADVNNVPCCTQDQSLFQGLVQGLVEGLDANIIATMSHVAHKIPKVSTLALIY